MYNPKDENKKSSNILHCLCALPGDPEVTSSVALVDVHKIASGELKFSPPEGHA